MRLPPVFGAMMIASLAAGQVNGLYVTAAVSATATQAILQYVSPTPEACRLKVADMNRRITIANADQAAGIVTVNTRAAHGITAGMEVYLEGTGAPGWDGWHEVASVPTATQFTFASGVAASAASGNVGVLIDDVNPALFPGSDLDSRSGNPNLGTRRYFVVGKRTAETAADGNRYTRALQAYSRHHYTLTCGTERYDQEFTTQNVALGSTYNEGLPTDRSRPGEYAYPTVQWSNRGQSLIDPLTGIRSVRATSPVGTPSTNQAFETAIDIDRAWMNPAGPLSAGGRATFTGPCRRGTCALFLRADSLSLPGGATYMAGDGVSLDWVTVTLKNASTSNSYCASDPNNPDCQVGVCLTVNGVTCSTAERSLSLTNSPTTYTVGSTRPGDLWQNAGAPAIARPDVTRAAGTVNYFSATRTVSWVSGAKFGAHWTAGSRINVAGSEYVIATVESEERLTLAEPGPVGDLNRVNYSANSFGVLLRKKTASADEVSIGQTTYQYGSSIMPTWSSISVQSCSSKAVTVDGVAGYNCFIDRELYWVSGDGSDVRDLGLVGMSYWPDGRWSTSAVCGVGSNGSQFDPLDGDTWYCLIRTYEADMGIVKATYRGAHLPHRPGAQLPDCGLNGGAQPCVAFTLMQPRREDTVSQAGPAFNPEYAASGYRAGYFLFGGISEDGDLLVVTRESGGQDTKGWQFLFTLGDRQPAGTGPNSMRPIAAGSSYLHAPQTWCSIHNSEVPEAGWVRFAANNLYLKGPAYTYTMALTSGALTTGVGGAGGLGLCPANPFGVLAQTCTNIRVSGEPTQSQDGSHLQPVQVGDLIRIDNEIMRVLAKTDSTHLTVQRGFANTLAAHTGTTLTMECGTRNLYSPHESVWNYRRDPYGRNIDWSTMVVDMHNVGGHLGSGTGVRVNSTAAWDTLGESACPSALLSKYGICYAVRKGTLRTAIDAPTMAVAQNPQFGGSLGFGVPNAVDSHPGPCLSDWCLDGRPMNGGASDGAANMLGSAANPWTRIRGQLWKLAGGATGLKLKTLPIMAYVGRKPLADASGPQSSIPSDASGAYRYCIALKAGECQADSKAGDAYVNVPLVSKAYCNYPGIANQGDDANAICIGPLGAYTGNAVQFGTNRQDVTGATVRRLGPVFSRWSQHSVFWNFSMIPTGQIALSQARWLDGIRHENMITVLPPYPASDSTARNTFTPVRLQITPKRGAGGNVIVEFGYGEHGSADSFYCTTRQETCVAASSEINPSSPFHYARTDTYAGLPCANGCTIAVPALSQRVLYYRWKELDGNGNVLSVSSTRAVTTP